MSACVHIVEMNLEREAPNAYYYYAFRLFFKEYIIILVDKIELELKISFIILINF